MVPNHLVASQALEPDVLIAVGKLAIGGQLVMIGDHCQLPPTVLSHKPWLNNAAAADSSSSASNTLLGKSLFERLVTLNLRGCDELTGSLHALANCTALVTLNLQGCDELTGVEKLQKALPQCRIISP